MDDFNLVEVAIGRRKTGKSTWAKERADDLSKDCYVLVHDPSGGFPCDDKCIIHKSLTDLVVSVEREGGAHIHVLRDRKASPSLFLETAWSISERSKRRSHYVDAAHPMVRWPVVAIFDEAALLHLIADPKEEKRFRLALLETITTGRHIGAGVGLIFLTQHANLLSYHALEQVTMLVLFKNTGGLCLQKLKMANVPDEIVDQLPNLGAHDFTTWEP